MMKTTYMSVDDQISTLLGGEGGWEGYSWNMLKPKRLVENFMCGYFLFVVFLLFWKLFDKNLIFSALEEEKKQEYIFPNLLSHVLKIFSEKLKHHKHVK